MANGLNAVSNFLVPATGSTNAYLVRETFSATPFSLDFRVVELDGLAFRPYGVYMDNTQGTGDLTVTIPEMSYSMTCPAGGFMMMPYPSPVDSGAVITGLGVASVIFVDSPVIPFSSASGGGGSVPNPLPVTGPLTDAELRAAPVPVSLPAGTSRTAGFVSATGAGATAAGVVMASFKNTGAANATVAGATLAPGDIVTFETNGTDTIAAIAYDGTGTTLQVLTLA